MMKKGQMPPKGGSGKVHNGAKMGSTPGESESAPFMKDSFGKSGNRMLRNASPKAMKESVDSPVTEPEDSGMSYNALMRPKSIADLREISKKLNEKGMSGDESPTGSMGGQDGKHMSSSKNSSGYMKAGNSQMDKKSMRAPASQSDQMAGADDMEDPLDEEEEDSGQYSEGMTPSGKSRKKNKSLKRFVSQEPEMD